MGEQMNAMGGDEIPPLEPCTLNGLDTETTPLPDEDKVRPE